MPYHPRDYSRERAYPPDCPSPYAPRESKTDLEGRRYRCGRRVQRVEWYKEHHENKLLQDA